MPPLREAGNVKAAEEDPNLTIYRYDSNWIFAGRMDMANPVLQDKAVREAIAHAIDRENLVKAAVSPTATVGNSPISIGWAASPTCRSSVMTRRRQRVCSRRQAGRATASGRRTAQPLSFTVTLYPDYAAPDIAAGDAAVPAASRHRA